MTLQIFPVTGIGAVRPGDDVAGILSEALEQLRPESGDIIVVTHKIVSKAEGAVVEVEGDEEQFRK